ncbi:VWFA-related domain-containing protein [Granulicella pectinivorans]|uniref:VWFA-related domain-containing protein n=1 Tax=Granulicella pectinivorans TaxID=474950 RepID=A0A1I6MZ32_9BACT|nr:VWA domain-containing protein [Granulicella pectinivorans]SFS20939.1 VWFA-related domain-containing protein [Granulicella pectinivorans]
MRRLMAAVMCGVMVGPGVAQQAPQQGGGQTFVLHATANIVLTNVVVRDKKTGAVVKGLKASDFTILENGKPQTVASFDYQNVDDAAKLAEMNSTVSGKASVADMLERNFAAQPQQLRDHRLIVMFFDLSSMQDEDIDRAVDAANDYVNKQMQPADLVALVSMSTGLTMDQDFTGDKTALLRGLSKYNGTDTTGFANGGTGSTDGTSDDTTAFAADDTEYNSLNTDRELLAIRTIAKSLEKVEQKKSMLYFSGGLTRNGIENQASLRAATNEATKANMAIYSVDTRGLQALPPVGDASKGSLRGNSAYSGKAVTAQFSANFSSQETLGTLSADTGGKAFFDSNDFAPAFQQVQHDTEAYYILGFKSTNQAKDGTFRHLTIKLNRSDAKVEYRPGYYAPADFQHAKTEDRELALTEAIRSDLPATDVAIYLQALYFRLEEGKFYVPVQLIIPGSQINSIKNGDKDKATIDIIGQVKNAQGIAVGNIRDTVKLALDAAEQVQKKNIQYSTGFTLAPGKYHLKFVVRENQTGNMGSFETDINVPDLKKIPLKLSSVVMSSQRTPNTAKKVVNPLIRDGVEWIPNVPHVFRQDQHLYFLYEVYDPAKVKGAAEPAASPGLGRRVGGPVKVLTSIQFMSGSVKVYETPLVEADEINIPERGAVAFQFDVPLTQLKPGTYTCQVNVIDDAGMSFSFPRMALAVQGPSKPAVAAPVASAPAL